MLVSLRLAAFLAFYPLQAPIVPLLNKIKIRGAQRVHFPFYFPFAETKNPGAVYLLAFPGKYKSARRAFSAFVLHPPVSGIFLYFRELAGVPARSFMLLLFLCASFISLFISLFFTKIKNRAPSLLDALVRGVK